MFTLYLSNSFSIKVKCIDGIIKEKKKKEKMTNHWMNHLTVAFNKCPLSFSATELRAVTQQLPVTLAATLACMSNLHPWRFDVPTSLPLRPCTSNLKISRLGQSYWTASGSTLTSGSLSHAVRLHGTGTGDDVSPHLGLRAMGSEVG